MLPMSLPACQNLDLFLLQPDHTRILGLSQNYSLPHGFVLCPHLVPSFFLLRRRSIHFLTSAGAPAAARKSDALRKFAKHRSPPLSLLPLRMSKCTTIARALRGTVAAECTSPVSDSSTNHRHEATLTAGESASAAHPQFLRRLGYFISCL